MKSFLILIIIITGFASCIGKPEPVAIIFDTDIAPDYDDVGALAMLHAFADSGEINILATMSSNAYKTTAPTLSVINTYFNRPGIPIGITKDTTPSYDCPRLWAENIIAKYPHVIRSNNESEDAVRLYRKILSAQPDTSVTIITVGFFTNLANLLNSSKDDYAPLNGTELVKKKVKRLVSMAGKIDSNSSSGYEANVMADIRASRKVFADWPTPISLSGHEIGVNIFTGMKLIKNKAIKNSPVKDAYAISLKYDGSTIGRYSWDQTAVLVAVRGIEPYFNHRKLNFIILPDGKDSVVPGDRINYITHRQSNDSLENLIEGLMMHQPPAK